MCNPPRIKLDAGEPYPASVLFPRDANKRIALVWRDSVKRSGVAVAVVRGERSFWTLPGGLGLGSTVAELEKRNGRPAAAHRPGASAPGQVLGWNNGALDSQPGAGEPAAGRLRLRPAQRPGPPASVGWAVSVVAARRAAAEPGGGGVSCAVCDPGAL